MNRYEMLQSLKREKLFNNLVSSGIISLTIATWLEVYGCYLLESKENSKVVSVQFASDKFGISERNIYRIILFMEN